ncbi:MAG: MarR family transcriptional regulator [Pseudobutyrivibrio sp.]|nr:MarR family transcriptional regulator [Pseudobutyrivibrio sp.]
MDKSILRPFGEWLEKHEILDRLLENPKLKGLGYSEVHTIVAIGDLDMPNVTVIADKLSMTKGAISKIIKKLQLENYIESFQANDNKQKIFYKLTGKGKEIYKLHEYRHNIWEDKDMDFLSRYSKKELDFITDFMNSYNEYLNEWVEELEETQREGQ